MEKNYNIESAKEELDRLQAENQSLKEEVDQLKLRMQLLRPNVHLDNQVNFEVDCETNKNTVTPHRRKGSSTNDSEYNSDVKEEKPSNLHKSWLSNQEIRRYGRQLILPMVGIQGQKSLKEARVLIVGAGGLGSPCGLYLASAGVGTIGIVDHDLVDASNLHRQIVHSEAKEGLNKAQSAKNALNALNSFCKVEIHPYLLDSSNAMQVIKEYDIIVDGTDNVATRYLLSDACVLSEKPLVSGSALRLHGQLTIYNFKGGPCYRCLYPQPPPAETVTNCSDGGVLGPVVGVIGCLQATEVLKIILGHYKDGYVPNLVLYSADRSPGFTTVKLRARKLNCSICGDNPTIRELIDYQQFCGSSQTDSSLHYELLPIERRITCQEFRDWHQLHGSILPHLTLDVREAIQFEICRLPNSINIPLINLKDNLSDIKQRLQLLSKPNPRLPSSVSKPVLFVVCRLGNDSQVAVQTLLEYFSTQNFQPEAILDVIGGLYHYSKQVDDQFPIY